MSAISRVGGFSYAAFLQPHHLPHNPICHFYGPNEDQHIEDQLPNTAPHHTGRCRPRIHHGGEVAKSEKITQASTMTAPSRRTEAQLLRKLVPMLWVGSPAKADREMVAMVVYIGCFYRTWRRVANLPVPYWQAMHLYNRMRKLIRSAFHGTDGFLLVEASPQSLIIAVCPSAAARFSIAFDFARVRIILENIFGLDIDIVFSMCYTPDIRTNFLIFNNNFIFLLIHFLHSSNRRTF